MDDRAEFALPWAGLAGEAAKSHLSGVDDRGSEKRKQLAQPCRVRGPCGRGDKVAVGHCGIDGDIGMFAVRQFDLRAAGGIG